MKTIYVRQFRQCIQFSIQFMRTLWLSKNTNKVQYSLILGFSDTHWIEGCIWHDGMAGFRLFCNASQCYYWYFDITGSCIKLQYNNSSEREVREQIWKLFNVKWLQLKNQRIVFWRIFISYFQSSIMEIVFERNFKFYGNLISCKLQDF